MHIIHAVLSIWLHVLLPQCSEEVEKWPGFLSPSPTDLKWMSLSFGTPCKYFSSSGACAKPSHSANMSLTISANLLLMLLSFILSLFCFSQLYLPPLAPALHCVMHVKSLPVNKVLTLEKSAAVWCLLWRIINCEATPGVRSHLTCLVQTISGVFVCLVNSLGLVWGEVWCWLNSSNDPPVILWNKTRLFEEINEHTRFSDVNHRILISPCGFI